MLNVFAGLVLLIIGDSHLTDKNEYLIGTFHDALTKQGAIVHTYGVCGSQPASWVFPSVGDCGRAERHGKAPAVFDRRSAVDNWQLRSLVEQHRPDVVVVVLGDTLGGFGQPDLPRAWIWEQVSALTTELRTANLPCAWIGPPWGEEGGRFLKAYSRVQEVSDFLSQTVAPCGYINSLALGKPGAWKTYDGQHFQPDGYRAWTAGLMAAMNGLLPYLVPRAQP